MRLTCSPPILQPMLQHGGYPKNWPTRSPEQAKDAFKELAKVERGARTHPQDREASELKPLRSQ